MFPLLDAGRTTIVSPGRMHQIRCCSALCERQLSGKRNRNHDGGKHYQNSPGIL
jgi:hypothetical protein